MTVIAVTGATGFVGRAVVAELLSQGVAVRALARKPEMLAEFENLSVVAGDISSSDALIPFLSGVDGVVHCAGLVKALSNAEFQKVNAEGTQAVVTAATNAAVKRLVLVSSLAARRPEVSPYAASKRAGEQRASESALNVSIVRPPAVYGPGDTATLPFFRQAERGFLALPVPRDQRFSVIYVTDLAKLLAALVLESDRRDATPIECDDGRKGGYSWEEFAQAAGAAAGRRVRFLPVPGWLIGPVAVVAQALAKLRRQAEILSPGKLCEMAQPEWVSTPASLDGLDWRPAVGLRDGLAQARRWYKDQGLLKQRVEER
ncbi:SDR family NAD(P)-dependent oxidoreductase [Limibacillus sp. MBR-115]|jgi:nucleoside-diphosphate-sugar epimerase|uniref:NAD-dependent epimerase/dehydratase family protein n=1 Tax=Limibacillus sp. MBR-115 TaxID=3156465 RepID=UPI003391F06E